MQGIVFDIKRFAIHDGPGIRTTIFLKGCPLKCYWCHNPESISPEIFTYEKKVVLDGKTFTQAESVGKYYTVDELMKQILRDRSFMEESQGGVTFSGGEPTMQAGFLEEMLRECNKEGIHTCLDTCGYTSQLVFQKLLPLTQLVLFDLKHIDNEKHAQGTGLPNKQILENLNYILSQGKKVRIRIPVIPGYNFYVEDITVIARALTSFTGNIEQIDLLPFHSIASNKYKRFGFSNRMNGVASLHKHELNELKAIFEQAGMTVKIGG